MHGGRRRHRLKSGLEGTNIANPEDDESESHEHSIHCGTVLFEPVTLGIPRPPGPKLQLFNARLFEASRAHAGHTFPDSRSKTSTFTRNGREDHRSAGAKTGRPPRFHTVFSRILPSKGGRATLPDGRSHRNRYRWISYYFGLVSLRDPRTDFCRRISIGRELDRSPALNLHR